MLIGFFVLAAMGDPYIATALLAAAFLYSYASMPRDARHAMAQEMTRREKLPLHRAMKVLKVITGIIFVLSVGYSFLRK